MGPLNGVRIVEMGGIGPGPHGAMMQADMGADILRIDRPNPMWAALESKYHVMHRGRRSVIIDLKKPGGIDAVLKLVDAADALIEGFRPGVMEKLGLGPEPCLERNPRLVYGRITGWDRRGRSRRRPVTTSTTSRWWVLCTPSAAGPRGRSRRST